MSHENDDKTVKEVEAGREEDDELESSQESKACGIKTEEEENFQAQRENLTWDAALKYLEEYEETEDDLITSKEKELYARQTLLKGWDQKVLKKSKILVAGLGTLGRELVKDLALIGVGSLTIVDPETLENVKEPKFLIPPVEGPITKVQVVKESLSRLNPFMEINTISDPVEEIPLNTLREHDLLVGCMNNFRSRTYLYEACKRFNLPYFEGACLGMEGFVQCWMPGDDFEHDDELFSHAYSDDLGAGETNQAAASILAGVLGQEIIKAAFKVQGRNIGDIQMPRYIKYDGATGKFETYPEQKDLLLRRNKIYELDRKLLKGAMVFIAGVGALGCEIAKDLALAGIGKLILVDLDTIETSNLSRQLLFRLEDIGKPKAEVAAIRVKELNPDMDVEFYFTKIQDLPQSLYENSDVIIAALDNVQARFDLNVIARKVKRPMIEGGTVGFEGHVQVIIPDGLKLMDETACYRCVVPIPPPDNRLIAACTPKGIPQTREHCVLRAEFIFRKKKEREPDLENKEDLILLTGASNKELEMLKERDLSKDHGPPFVLQDMENILKNKIPAIQTVSSAIASIESMEALKMACIQVANKKIAGIKIMDPTYINYNGIWGIIEHLPVLKREECPVCGTQKGIEFVQIPINEDSTIEDIFLSMQKIGIDVNKDKTMITNPETKSIYYHKNIPKFSDVTRKLKDLGIKPGQSVLLTPFGLGTIKKDEIHEPLKYQVTLISVS
ncbi:MAG: ThiF family adenylyltransferase [Promethearchaeota archaeon]